MCLFMSKSSHYLSLLFYFAFFFHEVFLSGAIPPLLSSDNPLALLNAGLPAGDECLLL